MRIVIFTRFSLYFPQSNAWRLARDFKHSETGYRDALFSKQRLRAKLRQFKTVTARSVAAFSPAYNIWWIIAISPNLPETYKHELQALNHTLKSIHLQIEEVETDQEFATLRADVLGHVHAKKHAFATVRLDDDDALAPHYPDVLLKYSNLAPGTIVSFPNGRLYKESTSGSIVVSKPIQKKNVGLGLARINDDIHCGSSTRLAELGHTVLYDETPDMYLLCCGDTTDNKRKFTNAASERQSTDWWNTLGDTGSTHIQGVNTQPCPIGDVKYDFVLPQRNDNEIRFIYCGTLRDEDNILEIIEEFSKIRKVRQEVLLKIVYGEIVGSQAFIEKVNAHIRQGVDGCTFKQNLSDRDTCYEIATSDIGICWTKREWENNRQVEMKIEKYKMYGLYVCYTLDSNINDTLDKYNIKTYVLAYDDYERRIFQNNLIYNLEYQFMNGNHNDKIAQDILNKNTAKKDFFINTVYSDSKIKMSNQYGHVNAMIHILDDAIENNYENVFILEYDVHFHVIFPSIFKSTVDKLNSYPIVYVGASKHKNCMIDHAKHIYKGMTGTFAVILNKCVLNNLKNALEQKLYPSDVCLIEVCKKHRAYVGKTDCIISNVQHSTIRNLSKKSYSNTEKVYKKFHWIKKYYYFAKREMRLGIIVCLRNGYKDLSYFLQAIKRILNGKNYKIMIVNQGQNGLFRKKALFNIGYILIKNLVDYVVFHDVDLIPLDDYYQYDGRHKIKHLSKHVLQLKPLSVSDKIDGWVEYFDNKTFECLDGFHNFSQQNAYEEKALCKFIKQKKSKVCRPDCHYMCLPDFDQDIRNALAVDNSDPAKTGNVSSHAVHNQLKKYVHSGLKSVIDGDFKVRIGDFDYIDKHVIFANVNFENSHDQHQTFCHRDALTKNFIARILNVFRLKDDVFHMFTTGRHGSTPSFKCINNNYKPLISCILPVYNGFPGLKRSVESVINQTFKFFELIIVNDGSTDQTDEYLSSLTDDRVVYIKQEHLKLPAALNTGLQRCRGKYITWTSHDNYYQNDAFLQFFAALEKCPEVDFVYSSHEKFGDTNNIVQARPRTVLEMILRFPGVCGFMWTKRISNVVGFFDTTLNGIEDYDYWTRILLENPRFMGIKKVLYHYNVHKNSMSFRLKQQNKYYHLDKKVALKIRKRYPHMLDIDTFFPFLKDCNDKFLRSVAYYVLGLSIINTTRPGFKEVFCQEAVKYFQRSYELNNAFTPALINIILCCKMTDKTYDIYLQDMDRDAPNYAAHHSFIKNNKINIKKLLRKKITMSNLPVTLVPCDLSGTDFHMKKNAFMNDYIVHDAIYANHCIMVT